jgi:hypothetical protein
VLLGDVVRELVPSRADRDDDRQVVEELERRGDAMLLVGVPASEPAAAVRLDGADRASLRLRAREHILERPP